jgi:ketosteroid isomerase-like protein
MKTLLICVTAILFAAGVNIVSAQDKRQDPKAAKEITAALNSTAEGWNAGDLSKYLAAYVPEATEMTGEGPKGGVEYIEQTMKNGFWKTGRPLQVLRYENLSVRMLGKNDALVTGQYILSGGGKPDRKGWFTTVWTKTNKGWRMIHDHS